MMRLERAAQAGEDFLGVLQCRLDHVDLLEPAEQRAVLFEMVAELLVCRRADAADHAARQRGLEQVRRIHRAARGRSEEHTSELQSLMRISYAVFCLKKKKNSI